MGPKFPKFRTEMSATQDPNSFGSLGLKRMFGHSELPGTSIYPGCQSGFNNMHLRIIMFKRIICF